MGNKYSYTTSTFIYNIKYKINYFFTLNISLLKFKVIYVINFSLYNLYGMVKILGFIKLTYHILIILYSLLVKDKLSQICSLYVKLHNLLNTTRCGKLLYLETDTHLLTRESYLNDVKMSYT